MTNKNQEWQPIETAPRHQAFIGRLGWAAHTCIIHYVTDEGDVIFSCQSYGSEIFTTSSVTHWIPLPDLPEDD